MGVNSLNKVGGEVSIKYSALLPWCAATTEACTTHHHTTKMGYKRAAHHPVPHVSYHVRLDFRFLWGLCI